MRRVTPPTVGDRSLRRRFEPETGRSGENTFFGVSEKGGLDNRPKKVSPNAPTDLPTRPWYGSVAPRRTYVGYSAKCRRQFFMGQGKYYNGVTYKTYTEDFLTLGFPA